MLSFLAVFLSLAIVFIGRVQATCNCSTFVVPVACTCRESTLSAPLLLELDCSHSSLSNLAFLTSLSEEGKQCVERLDVSGNGIHQVRAADLFGFSNLKDISLAANRLDGLEQDIFMNVTSLERLNLSDNSIHQLPPFVFANLVNLKQLSLSRTNLTSFPDLSGLSNLTILQLDDNAISTINRTKFKPLEGPNDWQDFDLTGNPLICDCRLAWIVDWLSTYSVAKISFRATCDGPTTEVTGQLVSLLKKDQFRCDQNECLEQNGGCEHGCNNTYGSYECWCRSGYMLFNQSRCGIRPAAIVSVLSDSLVPLPTALLESRNTTVITTNGNVTLMCTASGVPTPSVQWKFKGNTVNYDPTVHSNGHLQLQLNDVQLSDAGQYHCSAQNPLGFAQEAVELEVWPEPDPPVAAECSEVFIVTSKGEFNLPPHVGVEKFLLQPCIEGPLCGVSSGDAVGVFKCFDSMWHEVDTERCQYTDTATRDLQCLSVFSVNDSTTDWVTKQLRSQTIDQNLNYFQISFAIDILESVLMQSTVLSATAVEHIIYTISQLMAAPELSAGQAQVDYSNRLSSIIHRIAHLKIDYPDSSYMLSIDSPLLRFEAASAGDLPHLVFNRSSQASVRLPAGLLTPAELESSASGSGELPTAHTQNYVSLPGNTGYLAQYHSDVLFQHGVAVVQDACQLDDCHKHWQDVEINAPIISVGTGKAEQSQNQSSVIQLAFQPLQDGIDPLCVHWDYAASDGNGGWSCGKCSLKVWLNDEATCECTAGSATYTVLMTNCNGSRSDRCQCRGVERGTLADVGVISCYISIAALTLALIVLFISWLKSDKVSRQFQVKFNIGLAALWVAVMYIVSVWPDRDEFINTASCKVVASLLHYFLTAMFLWLATDAYVVCTSYNSSKSKNDNDSKKNADGDSFMARAALICWGIPILVISVCHIIGSVLNGADCYLYGATVQIDPTVTNGEERAQVCWIKSRYVVVGVLAAPAFVVITTSIIIYCYALNRKSTDKKDWLSIIFSLVLVLLIGVAWAFGLLTLTNHTEFSHSTCKSFSVFYYFYGVAQSAAAVTLLISSCFITDEVKQGVKALFTRSDDIVSSASEEHSEVLSFSSGVPQVGNAKKKGKRKGLRAQTSSGYVKSGDEIPLETLISLMPFSMDLGQHQVASPAIRESVITENTEGKTMTVATRSVGEGQSIGSSWEGEEDGEEQKLIVDVEEQDETEEEGLELKNEKEQGDETEEEDEIEKQEELEKQDETKLGRDEETMEKKSVGYDGDESGGDTTESCVNEKSESHADTDVNSSVTETRLEFREDGVFRTDTENDSPSPLLKRPHRKEVHSQRDTQPVVSLEKVIVHVHVPRKDTVLAVAAHEMPAQQAAGKGHLMEDEESESADKVSELPGPQDTLAQNIQELDDMLSVSQASLQDFEESLKHERLPQAVPPRTSRSVPTHLSHVVYPPHQAVQSGRHMHPPRRDRSVRKLLVPPKSGAVSTPVSFLDTRGQRYERPVVGSRDPMVITEVRQPRRGQPPSVPPGSRLHYERKIMGHQRALPYPEMYEAHRVRRPQAYPSQPQYYSPDRRDDYRYYRQPIHHPQPIHNPRDGYYDPRQRRSPRYGDRDLYYEMQPPPRQYYQAPQPGPGYYAPDAYPQRRPPRPGRVVEYSYATEPVEFMDGHMFESRRPPRPVMRPEARQRPARRAPPTVAHSGYRLEKMDQLFFFPGTAQETKTLDEGLHGEDDDSAVDTWYDDQ